MEMQPPEQPVLLHVYDLSSGLAAQLSKALLGKQVSTSWMHKSIGLSQGQLPRRILGPSLGAYVLNRLTSVPSVYLLMRLHDLLNCIFTSYSGLAPVHQTYHGGYVHQRHTALQTFLNSLQASLVLSFAR